MYQNENKVGTILVAMSGGVDSSVVAAILKKRGYDVIGITMQIWQESQVEARKNGCCSLGAVEDARRVARKLDIPHYVINYKDEFKKTVIDYFIDEYSAGRTPNPCVQCNKKVKFESLFTKMKELGCTHLATGHYVRSVYDDESSRYLLKQAVCKNKDQSYVLYMLSQDMLSKLLFPLGDMDGKHCTRELAREFNLPVANKPDSQEICFVSEAGGYTEFLRKNRPDLFDNRGEFVNTSGEVVGSHDGVANFTVGQRKGIGVTHQKPLYVISLEPKTNKVIIGEKEELEETIVPMKDVHLNIDKDLLPIDVVAKIRYNMDPTPAILSIEDGKYYIKFADPVKAITPGQMAVAYINETVIGGGVIYKDTNDKAYLN